MSDDEKYQKILDEYMKSDEMKAIEKTISDAMLEQAIHGKALIQLYTDENGILKAELIRE